jgi:flagellar basal-body rod modification protein FlgD
MIHPGASMNPVGNATGDSGAGSGEASTISANDFLTLLVTEMKNQDPTAQTDPNEYINQLVQVNSLEQLIQINQNLSTAVGTSDTGSTTGKAVGATTVPGTPSGPGPGTGTTQRAIPAGNAIPVPDIHSVRVTSGNLGVPQAIPAAQRVAQGLSGR